MNDKQLAERIVALGVGDKRELSAGNRKWYVYSWDLFDKDFVRDWRIAGALMERCVDFEYQMCDGCVYASTNGREAYIETDSLPRAICETCVEFLDAN